MVFIKIKNLLFGFSILTALTGSCAPRASLQPLQTLPAGAPTSASTAVRTTLATDAALAARTATPTTLASPSPTSSATVLTTAAPASAVPAQTVLLFTGVIVPARCVQAALDANGNPDHPYEEIRPTIQSADLAVGVFNATMSDEVVHTGCVDTYQLVGSPQNADALQRAGFDLMSVATNHIKDCGLMKSWCNSAFFDTLDNLRRVGIPYVGAGENLDAALQPQVLTVNGVRFGFVALGDSRMDLSVFATDTNPGIAFLNEENLRRAVAAARRIADVVVALPHWGSEDNFVPNWNQRTQAQQFADAGVDLIVGSHTHVVQAISTVDGVPVFYGLGNFVFDQGLRDHRQAYILLVRFKGAEYAGYEVIPTYHSRDGRVMIAGPEDAAQILENIERASDLLE